MDKLEKILNDINYLWYSYGALSIIGIVILLSICLVAWLVKHPNEAKIIKSWILKGIVWTGVYDRLYVSSDIEGRIGRIT